MRRDGVLFGKYLGLWLSAIFTWVLVFVALWRLGENATTAVFVLGCVISLGLPLVFLWRLVWRSMVGQVFNTSGTTQDGLTQQQSFSPALKDGLLLGFSAFLFLAIGWIGAVIYLSYPESRFKENILRVVMGIIVVGVFIIVAWHNKSLKNGPKNGVKRDR